MSFTATVENGAIKLPPGVELPEGAKVRVEAVDEDGDNFGAQIAEFIGAWKDGPVDAADNHDHYLYGTAKRVQ